MLLQNWPSVIAKGTSYFNIFECGRNILDQIDVTFQRAFMASPLQNGFYQPSPARERYYDKMSESLIKAKGGSDRTINNYELLKAITKLKSEEEAGNGHNILDTTQVDDYKSPWKDKDATTVNYLAYTFLNEYEDEISDSSNHVEASKEPIKDTHIHNTSVGTTSVDSAITGVRIIWRGGRGINQGMISEGPSIISSKVITDALTDSSKMILKSDSFPLNPLKFKTLVIASHT